MLKLGERGNNSTLNSKTSHSIKKYTHGVSLAALIAISGCGGGSKESNDVFGEGSGQSGNAINSQPVATFNSFSTNEDTEHEGQLTGTDTDGDNLSYSLKSGPSHGTIQINTDGSFIYSPNQNYNGSDSFEYTISDGKVQVHQKVIININPINDKPVAYVYPNVEINEDGQLVIPTSDLFHDHDYSNGDTLNIEIEGTNYGATLEDNNLIINGFPVSYDETFSIHLKATDSAGEVAENSVRVKVLDTIPNVPVGTPDTFEINEDQEVTKNIIENDYTPFDSGIKINEIINTSNCNVEQIDDNNIKIIPSENYYGECKFQYIPESNEVLGSATDVTINVLPVDDPSIIIIENIITDEDTPIPLSKESITQDIDTPLNDINITFSETNLGNFNTDENGNYLFTPNENIHGEANIKITANGVEKEVPLVVNSVNDAPIPTFTNFTINESENYSGVLSATDVENDDITFEFISQPSHGKFTYSYGQTGEFTYKGDDFYSGTDSFSYKSIDQHGAETVQVVDITINSVDHGEAPILGYNTYEFINDGSGIEGFINVSDPENNTLNFELIKGFSTSSGETYGATGFHHKTGYFTWNPYNLPSGNITLTMDFKVTDGSNITEGSITLNIKKLDPYKEIRPYQEGGEYYRNYNIDELESEGYSCISGYGRHICKLEGTLSSGEVFTEKEYVFDYNTGEIIYYYEYEEGINENGEIVSQIKKKINFQQEGLLVLNAEYFDNNDTVKYYQYTEAGVLAEYRQYNENGKKILWTYYSDGYKEKKHEWSYHENGETKNKTTTYYIDNGILERTVSTNYYPNGEKKDRTTLDYDQTGMIVTRKEYDTFENDDLFEKTIHKYNEVTGRLERWEKSDEIGLFRWIDYEYHSNGEVDEQVDYRIGQSNDVELIHRIMYYEDGTPRRFYEYEYLDGGYDGDSYGNNNKEFKKYYFDEEGKTTEKKLYSYRSDGTKKTYHRWRYNEEGLLYEEYILHYDSNGDFLYKEPIVDNENGISDPNRDDSSVDTTDKQTENVYKILWDSNTGIIKYFNKDGELMFSRIDPDFIQEDDQIDSIVEIIGDELPTEYKGYEDIGEYTYVMSHSPTLDHLIGYQEGKKEALINTGENIKDSTLSILKSSWQMIEWAHRVPAEAYTTYMLDLTPEQEIEAWGTPAHLSDIPDAIGESITGVIDTGKDVYNFIKDDLFFYYDHKGEIIQKLIINSGKTQEHWEGYFYGYTNQIISQAAAMTAVSIYGRKPQLLKKAIEGKTSDLKGYIYFGVESVRKLRHGLVEKDERFTEIINLIDKKDRDINKKNRLLQRYSRIKEDRYGDIFHEYNKYDYINDFETNGKYNILTLNNNLDGANFDLIIQPTNIDGKYDFSRVELDSDVHFILGNHNKGHIDFVLKDGELVFGYRHMKLAEVQDIDYGGQIMIDFEQNKILKWSNGSGHYEPNGLDFKGRNKVIKAFKEKYGIDLNEFEFESHINWEALNQ